MKAFGSRTAAGFLVLMTTAVLMSPVPVSAEQMAEKAGTGNITGRVFLDENADTFFRECDCDCGLEDIPVRLYRDRCGGLIVQTVRTDEQGYFHFLALEPGEYCIMPDAKMICEGYQPTKSLTQRVQVNPGATVEAEWFGLDHFTDINE